MERSQHAAGIQLGQAHPTAPNTFEVVAAGGGRDGPVVEITLIVVANTAGTANTFRLCHDVDGNTYTIATALFWDKSIAANDTTVIQIEHAGGGIALGKNGNLAFSASSADEVTCTVYGVTGQLR